MMSALKRHTTRRLEREDAMLADFDVDEYRRKILQASQAVCTVSYRNPKGEDVRSMAFLCVIRLPNRGNIFGLMTNSAVIGYSVFESKRYFNFSLDFNEALDDLKEHHFEIEVHRDVESWFTNDVKHLGVTFMELRPELQLDFVANGCTFLSVFEPEISLVGREVLIMDETVHFTKGKIINERVMGTELKLSRFGLVGSPVLDDVTFMVAGVAKVADKFCREIAAEIHAIVHSIAKNGLNPMPNPGPAKRSFLKKEVSQEMFYQSKGRLMHIRDSDVIPFHAKKAINDRLQRNFILTPEDLSLCHEEHIGKIFPEPSLYNAVLRWQKRFAHRHMVQERNNKKPEVITLPSFTSLRLARYLRQGLAAKYPDCFREENYFTRWTRNQKKTLSLPGYVRAIFPVSERISREGKTRSRALIIVITADGDVTAYHAHDLASGPVLTVRLTMPEQTSVESNENSDPNSENSLNIVHAVYDSVLDCIYLTRSGSSIEISEDEHMLSPSPAPSTLVAATPAFSGISQRTSTSLISYVCRTLGYGTIYRIRVAALKEAAKSHDDPKSIPTIPLKVLLDGTITEGRQFWGLSIDSAARLLMACDNGGVMNDISIWRLPVPIENERLEAKGELIASPILHMASIKSTIIPAFCAFNAQLDKEHNEVSLTLAVSDWRSFRVELFSGSVVEDKEQLMQSSLYHVCTVAKRDRANLSRAGFVAQPCDIAFDPQGNLVVADQRNRRIALFTTTDSGEKPLRATWMTKLDGAVVERFTVASNARGRAMLLAQSDYKTVAVYE